MAECTVCGTTLSNRQKRFCGAEHYNYYWNHKPRHSKKRQTSLRKATKKWYANLSPEQKLNRARKDHEQAAAKRAALLNKLNQHLIGAEKQHRPAHPNQNEPADAGHAQGISPAIAQALATGRWQ